MNKRVLKNMLIIGGARSGKSHLAQKLALESGEKVLFVATAEAGDEEMRQRIEEHRKARPATWQTLEVTTNVGNNIAQEIGEIKTVVIDCVTLLINNIFNQYNEPPGEQIDASLVQKGVMAEIRELLDCIERANASFIIVTNETGLGLVPTNKIGRLYRDLLGWANQMLAQHCDEVYLMVAGIPSRIKPASTIR